MSKTLTELLGTDSIPKLLIKQALPASIGILVMSLNILIDTIFVGQWIGSNAIAAINVVLPVSFFIAALGMSIGVGGASIISRALGENNHLKAEITFGNQITLTFILTITVVIFGLAYVDQLIVLFGGKGSLFSLAKTYYVIVLYGVPVLAFCMMANNTIRAEGKPKNAIYAFTIHIQFTFGLYFYKYFRLGNDGSSLGNYPILWSLCFVYYLFFFFKKEYVKTNLELF